MGILAVVLALQDWSPLDGFDAAAHDFFSTSVAERLGLRLGGLEIAPKIPFAQGRDRWRGETVDVALSGAARLGDVQLRLGMSMPFVPDDILAREPEVETRAFPFAGAAFTWSVGEAVSLGAELELNTCAFGEEDLLRRHPLSAAFGARAVWGALTLDAGLGLGVDRLEGWDPVVYVGIWLKF